MPDIEMTQTVKYWSLHTEDLMGEAASDIYHDATLGTVSTVMRRSLSANGSADIYLEIIGMGQVFVPKAPLGTTLVRSAAGWEVLADAESTARGIPVPTTPAT